MSVQRDHDVFVGGGETGRLMRSVDWSKTALGPVEGWPQSLRTAVSILLESRFPMYIAWGPTFTQLYNDGYRPILGSTKHPAAMGLGAQETFAESWHIIGPMFEGVRRGTAVGSEDWMLPLDRHGYLEECYFTFSYSPIRDESGDVGGVLVTVTETTGRVLGERRLRTLRDLATAGAAQSEDDTWRGAAGALGGNPFDVPFALLYRSRPGGDSPELVASAGWTEAEGAARFAEEEAKAKWPLLDAATTHREQLVTDVRARFGDLPGGAWPEPPAAAMVLPITRPRSTEPYGFLVAGLSARRAPDADYRSFLELVADQVASAIGKARSFEDEKRRAEALEELDRAKTAFFSNVSHEFRTPLTLMLGPVEDGLADVMHPLPPAQRERQELVRRNGLRLQKLVNTLLDFARVESGRAHAAFVPTDLATFTTDLTSSFESALSSAGLSLVIDCPPLPESIHVDPAMWEKIVSNLVSNAFKFTFRGEVRVALSWAGEHVALSVTDTGTGIPEDELPRIFDRFYRVEGARGRSYEGTGIGLALVQELVKLHGGRVEVKSQLGAGTTFTVTIPTGSAHLPAQAARTEARTLAPTGIGAQSFLAEVAQWNDPEASPEAPSPVVGSSARILVVDDNSDMRGYLARILSPHWAIETASDGERALVAAQTHEPDLVISDVMMPGLDGLGLVRALRADERTRTIPVMLLSARAGEEATIEGLGSGADAYLVKPFSANELLARVSAQLTVSRLRREAVRLEREKGESARRHLDEAQRATRSREETLASVSHDLRTPLGTISSAAQLIARSLGADAKAGNGEIRKWTGMIERSVDRMNRLLADLLDLASIEAGTLSFEPRPQRGGELVQELREIFEGRAAEKGLKLETAAAEDLRPFAGDRGRLLQALGNLLSNAIKFTPPGGVVRLRAGLGDDARSVRFSVEDSGPGIPEDAQPHVFDRYWHGNQRNGDSHGLGLAIAKGIALAHGGQIELTSTPGSATTFSITLPLEARSGTVQDVRPNRGPAVANTNDESFARGGGELGTLIRAFDWSTTALGPMKDWPQSLRTSVSTMLRSPYPITLFWGPELVMLYNDPFRPIHGDKHPATLGASARRALAEAWDVLGPLVQKTLDTGEPLYVENGLVMFARQAGGLKEESYFTWSYNPTIGEDGEIAGLFAIANETTRQVVGDRRLGTLRDLSLRTAYDRSVEAVLRSSEGVLATAGSDVPFALLYVVEPDGSRLAICTGLERGAEAAPTFVARGAPAPWPLDAVAASGEEVLLEGLDAKLGTLHGGPWPEGATRALVLEVPMGADTRTAGVLVAGLSPRLSVDDDYRSFLQLLARQISASISSARAYEEESERAHKLAELDRAKTDFFSNVSHELRTPLTLILGPVEDALAQPDCVLEREKLALVRRNALRLYKMVNTLLDFSRVEAGRAQATFVPTDLSAFTASLASHFQSAAESAGLELVIDCKPLPDAVYVDPEMWEKVVLNLLSNALKYTYRGRIDLRLEADDATTVLTVKDTGVGIAETEQAHVFERFYRVREARGRSHEGTGIGLALARELVELHGGSVSVASKLGAGSTFTVRMPRGSAHLPPERVTRTARPRSSAAGATPFVEEAMRWSGMPSEPQHERETPITAASTSPRSPARILLVDDNADLRSYVAGLLDRVYGTVVTAANGREALELARAAPPDLVLSDVMMPEMDGFALVRELRAHERTRSVPIILLSARAGDEATVEGLDTGADDYLVKPFSARELLARVHGQLEMSRVRAEIWRERGQIEELQHSLAARDEFIAVSSHELRTPLTALRIQIESLLMTIEAGQREVPSSRLGSKLGSALRQVDRMTRLVETLLDASQVAMAGLVLTPVELDLAELVRTVAARFEDDARASNARIEVVGAPVRGEWDVSRIDQVLASVLSNALKYAPGTIIRVAVDGDEESATVTVRDTGMGIPPEAIERVFERFERAVSTRSYGGFGIGLYLARQIVEAHGGSIRASATAPSGGTTIVMTLPIRQASAS